MFFGRRTLHSHRPKIYIPNVCSVWSLIILSVCMRVAGMNECLFIVIRPHVFFVTLFSLLSNGFSVYHAIITGSHFTCELNNTSFLLWFFWLRLLFIRDYIMHLKQNDLKLQVQLKDAAYKLLTLRSRWRKIHLNKALGFVADASCISINYIEISPQWLYQLQHDSQGVNKAHHCVWVFGKQKYRERNRKSIHFLNASQHVE